ncbi:phage major capsid protein [Nocardioides sp. J54]|uniref:phage major capsid protein n=1 Tax=Nocardioides sp. J54 TaxID=935866 RepID=UPI000491CD65|nr:phage major capsid protein [Nocardioides sp. J54]
MSSIADQLMERRAALINKAQEIAQRGVTEGRNLTVEEQTSFDEMIAEAETIHARAKAIHDGEQRGRELEESFRTAGAGGGGSSEARDGAFGKWAREARAGDSYDVAIESRDMSGTGGLGKSAVSSTLWEYAVAASEILGYAQLITTADGNTIPMPKATVHADLDGADLAPNDPIVESDSTLTTVDLAVTKRGFKTEVPNELLQDATFDVEGYIARNAGRRLGQNVAAAAEAAAIAGFTTAGVTTPAGVLTNLGTQSTAGQGSDLLVDLFHSVLAPYRASSNCAFGMSDLAAAVVRKLKTSTGEPVWQPSLVAGDPDLVLGKPVFIGTTFDSFAASKKPIYFGDWSALVVRIAGGLRFERSAEAGFGNDQTVFRAIVRRGAVALDPNAVKHLATPAS